MNVFGRESLDHVHWTCSSMAFMCSIHTTKYTYAHPGTLYFVWYQNLHIFTCLCIDRFQTGLQYTGLLDTWKTGALNILYTLKRTSIQLTTSFEILKQMSISLKTVLHLMYRQILLSPNLLSIKKRNNTILCRIVPI